MSSPTMCRVSSPARLLALAGALALALALLTPVAAHADHVTPARVDGETRFHTAANIATLTFDQADVAHVAFAGNFPDALAASFGAGSVDGPILLSETDSVPAPTLAALDELGAQQVVLVGGTEVLSAQAAAVFGENGYDVARISGANRYETASALAMQYGAQFGVGEIDDQRTALLASGENFPDALSAGGIAAGLQLPLLLTPPERTEASVDSALTDLDIERIVVIGGTAAVSSGVVEHYQAQGYDVERWGGATRTDTTRIVADQALARLGFTPDLTLLARGDNFPDALTASIHGGMASAPLLLSATPGTLSAETIGWLRAACPDVDAVRAIGGTAAIATATLEAAVAAAEECEEAHTEQTYIVAPQEPVMLPPGDTHDISIILDDDDPLPVEFALFPCANADPVNPPHTFADEAGDGHADGIGTTDTNEGWISSVDREPTPEGTRHVSGLEPGEGNVIEFTLDSAQPDCAVATAFHDANSNGELDVDGEGRPLEPFGYGQYGWE